MRAALLAASLMFTASVAAAGPVAAPSPAAHVTVPSQDWVIAVFAGRGNTDAAPALPHGQFVPAAKPAFLIEPLPIETTDDPRTGRRHRILQYRLDGVSVLGGAVGGSLGGHGAMLSLRWPNGQ